MKMTVGFQGPYEDGFDLVDDLRAATQTVKWEPPDRKRSGVLQDIVINLFVTGTVAVVEEVIRSFLSRHAKSSASVHKPGEIEDDTRKPKG